MFFTLQEKIDCAKRELQKRRTYYPRMIHEGRLSEEKAKYEIACMESIVETLQNQLPVVQQKLL